MNVPPEQALRMTLWQYEALLVNWNRNHETDPAPDPMTEPEFREIELYFADNPHLLN